MNKFSNILTKIRGASFLHNVTILASGTALSQGLAVLVTPVLTRLYTPDDFGIWSLFMSLAIPFTVITTLGFELAIVLPSRDEEAENLLLLSSLIAGVISGLSFLVVSLFRHQIAQLLKSEALVPLLWGLPFILLFIGLSQASIYWFIRKKLFVHLATSRLSQSAVTMGSQVGTALLIGAGPGGLISGTIAGQAIIAGILWTYILKSDSRIFLNSFSWASIKENIYRFRNFPLYRVPYSFIGAFSKRSLFLLLAMYATTHTVGLLTLAMKITYLPITIISSSLNQVFFQKAATQIKSGDLESFVLQTLSLLIMVATPILVFFLFNARWLFSIVFGEEWADAGTYAICLTLPAFILFLNSWLDRVYDVFGKQKLALSMEVLYDILSIGLFYLALIWLKNPVWAVGIYSGVTAVYNIIWLIITFKVAEFSLGGFMRLSVSFFGVGSIAVTVHWAIEMLFPRLESILIYIALMIAYYVYLSVRKKEWRQIFI